MNDRVAAERAISFGPFHLLPEQQLLLEGDRPVRLGSRAFEILIALVEHAGEVVGKDALIARVWPGIHVEESNLKFQIAGLRRALGDGHAGHRYIATLPGRGYSFVAPVTLAEGPKPPDSAADTTRHQHNLPASLTRLIGRADIVTRLADQLPRQRLLTIVGPGGIGKTSVALVVAERLIGAYPHGVWLTDLAPLDDPRLVANGLAAVLGLDIHSDDLLPGLITFLRNRQTLLVLDNCAHVIEAASALAAAVLRNAPDVHILATSREPLRIEGERIYRLPPLASPSASPRLTAAEALGFPAVQLFVERVAASVDAFALSDADAPIVAEICTRLDGIPLAIELAAARIDTLGVCGVAARLDERFRLLTGGRRTAPPRHRTLRATLDWSYGLLSELERAVLRRLAIFVGGFTPHAAGAVAADMEQAESEIIDLVAELVAKSLIAAEVAGAEPRLRLLDTTRAYALDKLAESGERERLARRHAEYYRELFERAEAEWEARPTAEWLADYGRHIDNLRAALDWAFSPEGDASIGMALTAAAVPLWMHLSLLEECRGRVEQALAALAAGVSRDARREMQLHAALGASLTFNRSAILEIVPEIGAAWTKALELAESLDDAEYRLRALWGLWFYHTTSGRHRIALTLAQRFSVLTAQRPDPIPGTPALGGRPSGDRLVGEQMIGISQHYLGDEKSARQHLERMLADYITPVQRSHIIRFQIDLRAGVRVFLAWILWLQGFPDQAMRTAESSIADASATNHAISLCYALAQAACPIALLAGDLAAAEHYARMLLDHAARHAPVRWHLYGRLYQGVLAIKRGDVAAGLQLLRAGLDERGKARSRVLWLIAFLTAETLGRAGRTAEGFAAIEEALAWTTHTDERWLMAELLRLKGELLLLQAAEGAAASAEDHFRQALDLARRQGALSWELRAAMSLARLWRDQGRSADGIALLQPVYGRFTEGFDTADLKETKVLLDDRHRESGRDA